jgi:hypothetical protein
VTVWVGWSILRGHQGDPWLILGLHVPVASGVAQLIAPMIGACDGGGWREGSPTPIGATARKTGRENWSVPVKRAPLQRSVLGSRRWDGERYGWER